METITKLDELIEQRVVQEEKISYMVLPGIDSSKEKAKKFKEKYWDCRHKYNFPLSLEEVEMYPKGYDSIVSVVCDYFGVPIDELKLKIRKRKFCLPRQICQYFALNYTRLTQQQIADKFFLEHATIINSIKTISNMIETVDARWNTTSIDGGTSYTSIFEKFDKKQSFVTSFYELDKKIVQKLIIDYKF